MHVVLNNSSKFNLTFRRGREKKGKKFRKKGGKLKKVVLRVFFFGRIDLIFKVLIYKNCIVKEYFFALISAFFVLQCFGDFCALHLG